MRIPGPIRVLGGTLLVISVFWGWYMVAADYGYGIVAGTYVYRGAGESSTLQLKSDRSFTQERNRAGKIEYRTGTWRRVGEGGIVFSSDFLAVGNSHQRPDGEVDGSILKSFLELVPNVVLEDGPRFHRSFFRRATLEKR